MISMFPVNEQRDIPAGEDITFTFNKEMTLRDDFVMTFTNELNEILVLKYVDEKSKVVGAYITVEENVVTVKGSYLPAGHTYFVLLNSEAMMDKEGHVARGVPTSFSFSTSNYACGGSYIADHMAENCTCFLTSTACECRCGESETGEDIIVRKML